MGTAFALIGDGKQAVYHKKAVEHVGGELCKIYDPKYPPVESKEPISKDCPIIYNKLDRSFFMKTLLYPMDYVIICSPSNLHREHTKLALKYGCKVIVEKPAVLPWEDLIDDDNINVSLQLRYLPDLPKKAHNVYVKMVRNEEYFKTWKGDPKLTGGVFFNLFIHYIDLAIQTGADFNGHVVTEPVNQERMIDDFDLLKADNQEAMNRMYYDIIHGGGIKPRELYYLNWILQKHSEIHGFGKNMLDKVINIPQELL